MGTWATPCLANWSMLILQNHPRQIPQLRRRGVPFLAVEPLLFSSHWLLPELGQCAESEPGRSAETWPDIIGWKADLRDSHSTNRKRTWELQEVSTAWFCKIWKIWRWSSCKVFLLEIGFGRGFSSGWPVGNGQWLSPCEIWQVRFLPKEKKSSGNPPWQWKICKIDIYICI